ncbi:uncharacterized protein LOC127844624 [Dreissena polymorpha]|uniref:Uncharacterized protein n=1 Tax=Dreissena polymorpha TaxID=45954 RepID=A0A9D4DWX3_DREPO|nr:uncharacterized protein LOC127844624 [Dreissena polymorpha]KAH3768983.1 hypothetical protein DPMN_170227 [Dreissena polymorpha]
MALMGRTQIGMKATGTTVTIPNNPKGKLMYYLSCIKNVLQMDDEIADMNRLTRYNQYYNLSDSDTDLLIVLGLALSPDVLMNKCIFQSDAMCGDSSNEFYEIEAVRSNLLVAGSVMIGGRSRRVLQDHDLQDVMAEKQLG